MASTHEQIMEVFEQEIREKSELVERKFGKLPFYDGCMGMRTFKLYDVDPCRTRYQGEK